MVQAAQAENTKQRDGTKAQIPKKIKT